MAKKFIPVRERPENLELQTDGSFRSWLSMQEAVMDLEFFVVDDPELEQHEFSREGLMLAESHLLDRHLDKKTAFSDAHLTVTMRYVYFIGETFRRATEGKWAALPPDPPMRGSTSAIEAEFTPAFYVPTDYLGVALTRRTGREITFVYDIAVRKHAEWVESGRPIRV